MTRQDLIAELIEKERQRLFESSEQWMDKPKVALTIEQQQCKERYKTLGQMYDEIRMLNMSDIFIKATDGRKQVFIGFISDTPDLYWECKDSKKTSYFINIKIAGYDGTSTDERLLKLSFSAWQSWFFYLRYITEKEQRVKNNQSILVKVIVYDAAVRSMSWYKHYNTKSCQK